MYYSHTLMQHLYLLLTLLTFYVSQTQQISNQVASGNPLYLKFGERILDEKIDSFSLSVWLKLESFDVDLFPIYFPELLQIKIEKSTQQITIPFVKGITNNHLSTMLPQVQVEAISLWFRLGFALDLTSYELYYNLIAKLQKTALDFSSYSRFPLQESNQIGLNLPSVLNQRLYIKDFVFYTDLKLTAIEMNTIYYQFQQITYKKQNILAYYKFEESQNAIQLNIYDTYYSSYLSATFAQDYVFEDDILEQMVQVQIQRDYPSYTYTPVTNKYDKSLLITSTIEIPGIQKDVQSFTIELWAKFQIIPTSRFYFLTDCPTPALCTNMMFGVYPQYNYVQLEMFNQLRSGSMAPPANGYNSWNYYAVSFNEHSPKSNPTQITLYLGDDVDFQTNFLANDFQFTSSSLYIAQDISSVASQAVLIKELRIWAPMRTQHDLMYFKRQYLDKVYPASLLQNWKIEYDYSNLLLLTDSSINNLGQKPLTNSNSQWINDPLVICDKEYQYDSTTDSCIALSLIEVSDSQDLLVEVWIYVTDNSNYQLIASSLDCGLLSCEYSFQIGSLQYHRGLLDGQQVLKSPVTASQWNHYLFYIKASQYEMYFNREYMGTQQKPFLTLTTRRSLLFAQGLNFQGYLKELKVYANFGSANFEDIKYLIFKNYRSTITNPTEYPFLLSYVRFTSPISSISGFSNSFIDFIHYDLTQRDSGIINTGTIVQLFSDIVNTQPAHLMCYSGEYWDGIQCRNDHLVVQTEKSTSGMTQKLKLGQVVYIEDEFSIMFWFSQKQAGTTRIESLGHPSVQLFLIDLVKQDPSSYYQFSICSSASFTQSYGQALGESWYHMSIQSISFNVRSFVIDSQGKVVTQNLNHGAATDCSQSAVPSTSVQLSTQNSQNIAIKDFAFILDAPTISQLTHVALYYEWTYDPYTPIICNSTDQYQPESMSCTPQQYRFKQANQCIITTWDSNKVLDSSNSMPPNTFVGIGMWLKILSVSSLPNDYFIYAQLGAYNEGYIALEGLTISGTAYNIAGEIYGVDSSNNPTGATLHYDQVANQNCQDQYCYLYLQTGGTPTPTLKLFRNGQLAVSQTYNIDKAYITNDLMIGCYAQNMYQSWSGYIQHLRIFTNTDLSTSHQNFIRHARKLYAPGMIHYMTMGQNNQASQLYEIDLRYDTATTSTNYFTFINPSTLPTFDLVPQLYPSSTYTHDEVQYTLHFWVLTGYVNSTLLTIQNFLSINQLNSNYLSVKNIITGVEIISKKFLKTWQEINHRLYYQNLAIYYASDIKMEFGHSGNYLTSYWSFGKEYYFTEQYGVTADLFQSCELSQITSPSGECQTERLLIFSSQDGLSNLPLTFYDAMTTTTMKQVEFWLMQQSQLVTGDIAQLVSENLGLLVSNTESLTICKTICNYFSLKDLKLWGSFYPYTYSDLFKKQSMIGLNSQLLGYYSFNEMGDYAINDQSFSWTIKTFNYNHLLNNKVVRWEDIDFYYRGNPIMQTQCGINQVLNLDLNQCVKIQDKYQTIEFKVTNDPLVLDFQTNNYYFGSEWSIEFYIKFKVYNDAMNPNGVLPIISSDTTCTQSGSKFNFQIYENNLNRYLNSIVEDGMLSKNFTHGTSFNEDSWYHIALVSSLKLNSLTFYINLVQSSSFSNVSFKRLATCNYKIAYNQASLLQDLRLRLKELRIWNQALKRQDFSTFDRIKLPIRYPGIAAIFKFKDTDFFEGIYSYKNYRATFKDYAIKYDTQIRNNCPLGFRQQTINNVIECQSSPGKIIKIEKEIPQLSQVLVGSTTYQDFQILCSGVVILQSNLKNSLKNLHSQLKNIHGTKYDHQVMYERVAYQTLFDTTIQQIDTYSEVVFPMTISGNNFYSLVDYPGMCMGGMNYNTETKGCLPKSTLKIKNAKLSTSFDRGQNFKHHLTVGFWLQIYKYPVSTSQHIDFFSLKNNLIDFQIDTSKHLQLLTSKAKLSVTTTTIPTFIIDEQTWFGIAAVKTSDGKWKIYNENTLLLTIDDTIDSYYGLLNGIQFGDLSVVSGIGGSTTTGGIGFIIKIKGIFGIAKELRAGELLECFRKQISQVDYKYSLLFYYKLDEDKLSKLYDSSIYGQSITMATPSSDGFISWDNSWDRVVFNEETWTNDFQTYQYMNRGIHFKNLKTFQLSFQPLIQSFSSEYQLEFCLLLIQIDIASIILGIQSVLHLSVSGINAISFYPNNIDEIKLTFNNPTITGRWLCISLANSIRLQKAYLFSDDHDSDVVKQNTGYQTFSSLPTSFYIGGLTTSQSFSGFLRHIKIFNKYRSIGQSRATLRHQSGPNIGLDYSDLLALYPLNEPIGNYLREQLLNTLSITVPNKSTKCFTSIFWTYLQAFSTLTVSMQDRFILIFDYNLNTIELQNAFGGNTLLISYQNTVGEMSSQVKLDENFIVNYSDSTDKLLDIKVTNNSILGYSKLYLKEFQFYENYMSTQWITQYGFISKNQDINALIGYYKLNEFTGNYLNNQASNQKTDDFIKDSTMSNIKWVSEYQINQVSLYNAVAGYGTGLSKMEQIYCFEQDTQLVDEHCESYASCSSSCFFSKECSGPQDIDCVQQPLSGIYQNTSMSNYYLDCYKLCATCTQPFVNGVCQTCLTGSYSYNSSCYKECPSNTLSGYDEIIQQNVCYTCDNTDCICGYNKQNECYGCVTGSTKFFIIGPVSDCIDQCPMGTYYDSDNLICDVCHPSCSSCYGPLNGQCFQLRINIKMRQPKHALTVMKVAKRVQFYDNLKSKKSGYCKNCDLIQGYSGINQNGECIEICGDNINYGQTECDDGNTISGDGCSELCKIEYDFACNTTGTCLYTKKPSPFIKQISKSNVLTISFDEIVKYSSAGELSVKDLEINIIKSDGTEVTFTWTGEIGSDFTACNCFQIQLDLRESVDGTEVEKFSNFINNFLQKIQIYFRPDGEKFTSIDHSHLAVNGNSASSKVQAQDYYDPETKRTVSNVKDQATTLLTTSLSLNFAVQFVMKGSMGQMFELINTIQILYYLPLIQVHYTEFLRDSLSGLEFANLDILLPDKNDEQTIVNKIIPNRQFDDQPLNQAFYDFGIHGTVFMIAYKNKILVWTCLAAIIVCPVFLQDLIMRKFDILDTNRFQKRFRVLLENQKIEKNKSVKNFWIPLFFMRRFCYAATIVILGNNGKIQLIISTFLTFVLLSWVVYFRPFKTKSQNAIVMLNEGTILLCFLTSFYFIDKDRPDDERMTFSYVIIFAIINCVFINLIFMGINMYKKLREASLMIMKFLRDYKNKTKDSQMKTKSLKDLNFSQETQQDGLKDTIQFDTLRQQTSVNTDHNLLVTGGSQIYTKFFSNNTQQSQRNNQQATRQTNTVKQMLNSDLSGVFTSHTQNSNYQFSKFRKQKVTQNLIDEKLKNSQTQIKNTKSKFVKADYYNQQFQADQQISSTLKTPREGKNKPPKSQRPKNKQREDDILESLSRKAIMKGKSQTAVNKREDDENELDSLVNNHPLMMNFGTIKIPLIKK
eukprot:403346735